jgi:methionine-rich copper-binding protein CopC
MKPSLAILAAVTAPFLFAAAGAEAHAHVVTSSPAANATVASPKAIHLQYNETLAAKFSGASLMTTAGKPVAVTVKSAGKAIDATPRAALAPGRYMVMWHAVADDGHKSKGQYNFTVK